MQGCGTSRTSAGIRDSAASKSISDEGLKSPAGSGWLGELAQRWWLTARAAICRTWLGRNPKTVERTLMNVRWWPSVMYRGRTRNRAFRSLNGPAAGSTLGSIVNAVHREPRNKGKIVGKKAPFKFKDIWALRVRQRWRAGCASSLSSTWGSTVSCAAAISSVSRSGTFATATGGVARRDAAAQDPAPGSVRADVRNSRRRSQVDQASGSNPLFQLPGAEPEDRVGISAYKTADLLPGWLQQKDPLSVSSSALHRNDCTERQGQVAAAAQHLP